MAAKGVDRLAASRALRLKEKNLVVDGVPFDLSKYPYMMEILDILGEEQNICIRKGAQMGFTVGAVLGVIDLARTTYPRGILYLMPTRDDVYDFSRSRFDRLLKDNYAELGRFVQGTDSMGIKRIGSAFIYFRGSKSRSQLKSIPVDCLVTDERDEMEPAMVDLAEKRLDGSRYRHHVTLSTPTIPDYGVDLDYKKSDQRMWHIKCEACGAWTCLEATFPECLKRDKKGRVYRACRKCEREIFIQNGIWKASNESSSSVGYYVSQLCSPTVAPATILNEYEDPDVQTGERLREFKNSRLGLAHADIEDVLSERMLREILGSEPMQRSAQGPCFMGVDVGKRVHHYHIGQRLGDRTLDFLRYGKAASFEELHDLATKFNVDTGVMDEMAETHAVREFVDAHPGWYGCWYSEQQKGDYDFNDNTQMVKVNRTELLDHSHRTILQKRATLPRPDEQWEGFVKQMTNLARITLRDEKTGLPKTSWIIRGGRKNDHWRHSYAYAVLAAEQVGVAEHVRKIITPREHARSGASFMSG